MNWIRIESIPEMTYDEWKNKDKTEILSLIDMLEELLDEVEDE